MKLIELHILQSFPVSCLNRDDMGSPKSAIFGGCKRARISSQCFKRAQRMLFREYLPEFAKGERTKYLASSFRKLIESRSDLEHIPEKLHITLAEAWGKSDSGKKSGAQEPKATTLTYLSPAEMSAMIEAALEVLRGNPKAKDSEIQKAAIKAMKGSYAKDAADIALYGRMVASEASLTMEGAGMFSHAISTHKSDSELDFYSAVDDLQPREETGAGMTGMLEFSSACYYRYIAVNVDLLRSNLDSLSDEELKKIIAVFVQAAVMAVPSARKNSMNASTVPSYVMGLVRNGHPLQLVNAFETPIRTHQGLVEPSVEAMRKEYARMKEVWGIDSIEEVAMPELNLNTFISRIVDALT